MPCFSPIRKTVCSNKQKQARFIFRKTALAMSALALCASASAASFSNMVFFGDSLTDTGYFKGVGKQASFTTNPDPVWAQLLARQYGLSANPGLILRPLACKLPAAPTLLLAVRA